MFQRTMRKLARSRAAEPGAGPEEARAADGERGGARRGPTYHMPRLVFTRGKGTGRDEAVGVQCTIGRAPGADIVVEDPSISRLHARIALEEEAYVIHDLQSRNGTMLNGRPIRVATLVDGDVLRIGHVEIVFRRRAMAAEAEPVAREHVLRPSVPASLWPGRRRRSGS